MVNIQVQCCCLVLLALVSYFNFRLPKTRTKNMWTFLGLLLIGIISTVLDIASIFAIYHQADLAGWFVDAVCKAYLACLALTVYGGLLYICSDFCKTDKAFFIHAAIYAVIALVLICVMFAMPIEYTCKDNGMTIYSSGAATTVAYVGFGIFFAAMVTYLIIGRNKISARRIVSVAIWLTLWLIAAIIQYLVPHILIVSFAGCVGILIIFMASENPEQGIDKDSPFFHTVAFEEYLRERYYNKKRFYLIYTRFERSEIPFYKQLPHRYIFVSTNNIYFMFKYEDGMRAALEMMKEHISNKIFVLENSLIVNSQPDLKYVVLGAQKLNKYRAEHVCHIDGALIEELGEEKRVRTLIDDAIADDRVEVYYQPIYSVAKRKFVSAEALARIRDKDGQIVPPYKFIPIAERDGTIIKLGKIIMDKTCAFLSENGTEALGLNYIEINLSVVQGEDKMLAEDVMSIVSKHNLSPDKINLEITESASVEGRKQLLDNMGKLISKGIEFSLDDFGTGQSNLDYIAAMPVKIIKFDRSMTQGYFESQKTRLIMTAAIKMIHEMGLEVVVEGIETAEQLEDICKLNVEYIQGFYFSKPLPKQQFVEYITKNNS